MTVIAEITEYRFKRSQSGAIRFGCFYFLKRKLDRYRAGVYYGCSSKVPPGGINRERRCEVAVNEEMACPHCSGMKKVRDGAEQRQLLNRLNRIEGQIRGVKKMLEEDAYCIDILNQVSAANCALNSFTKVLLAAHLKSCVAEDVREGNTEKLDELVRTLQKLMK